MDEKSINKRAWIKNIAIIFLVIMLILTFFSNTIMNFSLPEVSAEYARNGIITAKIRGTGSVKANQNYEIKIGETRVIASIPFKKGDKVNKGDVIFTLEDTESDELKTALAELTKMQYEFEKSQLNGSSKDYEALQGLSTLKAELAKAKTKLANFSRSEEVYQAALKAYDAALAAEQAVTDEITRLEEIKTGLSVTTDYDPNGKTTEEKLAAAKEAYDAALLKLDNAKTNKDVLKYALDEAQTTKDNADYALKTAQNAKAEFDSLHDSSSTVTDEQILAKIRAIEKLEIALQRTKESYDSAISKANETYSKAVNVFKEAEAKFLESQKTDTDTETYKTAQNTFLDAENLYNKTIKGNTDAMKAIQQSIQDQEIEIRNAKEDLSKAQQNMGETAAVSDERKRLKKAVTDAETKVNTAVKELDKSKSDSEKAASEVTDAQKAFDDAKSKLENYDKSMTKEEVQAKIDALKVKIKPLTAAKNKAKTELDEADTARKTPLEELQKAVTDKENELKLKQNTLTIEQKISDLDNDKVQNDIANQEAIVDKLKKSAVGATITAPVSGTLSAINAVAGEKATKDATIAEIQIVEKGFSLEFSVTNEQSQRIKVGDAAKVQYYWGSDLTANVVSIKPDTANPGKSKIVTLSIVGDVSVGQSLTFTLGESGQNYDYIVPNSAVREDNNGKFILTVTAKNTPLGNRYIATRVDVKVLASDETSSAISSVLFGGEFIITTSTKPVSAGTQVRLIES